LRWKERGKALSRETVRDAFIKRVQALVEKLLVHPSQRERPLLCLDEFCKQLLGEVRIALPSKPGYRAHCDFVYTREGSATAFPPTEVGGLAERFERHHTPRHGSWLNITESEISAVLRSAVSDRIDSIWRFVGQCAKAIKRLWKNSEAKKR